MTEADDIHREYREMLKLEAESERLDNYMERLIFAAVYVLNLAFMWV